MKLTGLLLTLALPFKEDVLPKTYIESVLMIQTSSDPTTCKTNPVKLKNTDVCHWLIYNLIYLGGRNWEDRG
jgi:hypothetical protein